MRKFIISLFCLLMLASTASAKVTATIAESGQIPVNGPLYDNWPSYVVHEGQPLQIDCQDTELTLIKDVGFSVIFYNTVLGYGVMSKYVAADSSGKCTIQIPSPSILTPAATPYRVHIWYRGFDASNLYWTDDGEVYLYVISATSTSIPTSVPEFPTIAVPISAILGLMFVFGGQKKSIE